MAVYQGEGAKNSKPNLGTTVDVIESWNTKKMKKKKRSRKFSMLNNTS